MAIPDFKFVSPIFCVSPNADDHLRTYLKLLKKPLDREFLLSLITSALSYGKDLAGDGSYYLDFDQMKAAFEESESKVSTGKTSTHNRLARLTDMVLFKRQRLRTPNVRGYKNAYVLQPPTTFARSGNLPEDEEIATKYPAVSDRKKDYYDVLKKQRNDLERMDVQLLDPPKELKRAHSERLLNNVFFACGRQSFRDSRRRKIVTVYPFKDERITVTATAGGDTDLFSLEDQNTVLAIITLIIFSNTRRIQHGVELKDIPNEYYLDICDLARVCGLEPTGANRETLRKSLDRLYHSNLHVSCSPDSKFAQYFGLYSYWDDGKEFHPDDMNFRFISGLDAASEVESDLSHARRPRYYRISLHPLIYRQLLDKEVWSTFVVDPQLLKNRLKMVTHLYFFAARLIHRTPDLVRTYPIETVQRQTMPAHTRFNNWQRTLFTELKKFAESQGLTWNADGANTLHLFGYFMKIEPDVVHGYTLTFWFNPAHHILGKVGNDGVAQKLLDLSPT